MNFSAMAGVLLGPVLILVALIVLGADWKTLWDPVAVLIVIIGPLLYTTVSSGLDRNIMLMRVFFRRLVGRNRRQYLSLIEDIVNLAKSRRAGPQSYQAARARIRDIFLRDAAGLLDWTEGEIQAVQLRDLLAIRAQTFYTRYLHDAEVFRTVALLPVKFGALGSLLVLAAQHDHGPFGQAGATLQASYFARGALPLLYGMIVTYLFVLPIADSLAESTEEERTSRSIVVEGTMMIHEKIPPQFIAEKLASFILPKERTRQP